MSNGETRRRRWQHHSCAEGAEGGNVLCRCSLKMAAATLVVVADLAAAAAVEQSANYYYYW